MLSRNESSFKENAQVTPLVVILSISFDLLLHTYLPLFPLSIIYFFVKHGSHSGEKNL